MDWIRAHRRHLAFAAIWALSSVLMGAIMVETARRVVLHYMFNPDFAAEVNARYLKFRLGLDDEQYRRAQGIMREGFKGQLALMPQRQEVWSGVYDRLKDAPDAELLEKAKDLQAINRRMPEINVGMVVQLRNLLGPEKRIALGRILRSQYPLQANLRPKTPKSPN